MNRQGSGVSDWKRPRVFFHIPAAGDPDFALSPANYDALCLAIEKWEEALPGVLFLIAEHEIDDDFEEEVDNMRNELKDNVFHVKVF